VKMAAFTFKKGTRDVTMVVLTTFLSRIAQRLVHLVHLGPCHRGFYISDSSEEGQEEL